MRKVNNIRMSASCDDYLSIDIYIFQIYWFYQKVTFNVLWKTNDAAIEHPYREQRISGPTIQ